MPITINITLLSIIFMATNTYYLIFIILLIKSFIVKSPKEDNYPYAPDVYFISVLIPAKNEENVIYNTVRSLLETEYSNLEVIVIAHNCCDNTALEAHKAGSIVLEYHQGTSKGDALNFGLQHAKGNIICVIDSDTKVPKNYFMEVAKHLHNTDALQTEVRVVNRGLIPEISNIEFRVYSDVLEFVSNSYDSALLCGNGQFINRIALEHVGGWTNSLTEDTEISLRLLQKGNRIKFINSTYIEQTSPTSPMAFIIQRIRWATGNLLLLPKILKLKGFARLNVSFCVISMFLIPFVTLNYTLILASLILPLFTKIHICFYSAIPLWAILIGMLFWPTTLVFSCIKSKLSLWKTFVLAICMQYLILVYFGVIKKILLHDYSWAKTKHFESKK